MQARLISLAEPIMPLGELATALPIMGRSLADAVASELALAELALSEGPSDEPVLALGDHTYITAELLTAFLAQAPPSGGRLALSGPILAIIGGLQDLQGTDPAGFPVYLAPRWPMDAAELAALPEVVVPLDATLFEPPTHAAFRDAMRPLPVTDRLVHTVSHWSHLLRCNLLAWLAWLERERRTFEALPWWRKIWPALKVVWRAKSLSRWRIAQVLFVPGPNANIHPTATVEASVIGRDVTIGPHAVVRGCWLGDGVVIGDHARVHSSVLCAGAQVSRGTMLNVSMLLEGALVSPGAGHQSSLFGRDSFLAHGVTLLDLSFGKEVRTLHRGQRQSAGVHFLGACIGHRARIGPHVVLGYGEAVPNDAFLVSDPARMFRAIPQTLPEGPVTVRDGRIVAVSDLAASPGQQPEQSEDEESG